MSHLNLKLFILCFRNVIALRLLDICMGLTERRANMSIPEVEAFRLMPDFKLVEAVLHNCLQCVWPEDDLPILDEVSPYITFI